MSVEYITAVFRADGIKYRERIVLLRLADLANHDGYCWPGQERLADDCGMSLRSVAYARAELTRMNIIRSVRRKNATTGKPITNLTRINLAELTRRARPSRDYRDDLMEDITFSDDPPSNTDITGQSELQDVHEVDARFALDGCTPCIQSVSEPPGERSSSSYSSADAPASEPEQPLRGDDDDEDTASGRPAADKTNSLEANKIVKAIPWPTGKHPRGKKLYEVRAQVTKALIAGWDQESLLGLLGAEIKWEKVDHPAAVVLKVLRENAEHACEARTAEEEAVTLLKAEIAALEAAVASCGVCDEDGFLDKEWHGHGRRGLRVELLDLENSGKFPQ